MNAQEKRAKLAETIKRGEFVTAPGVFDMVSARIADQMPFNALYMTGYGVAASHLGVPDAGIASFGDVVSRVRMIANGTNAPLICDGDTGFGGLRQPSAELIHRVCLCIDELNHLILVWAASASFI